MHLLCINYQQREHRRNNDVSSSAFSFPLLSFPARDVTSPEPVLFFCRHAAGHVLCERSSPGQASLDSGRPGDLLLQVSAPLVDHLCLPFGGSFVPSFLYCLAPVNCTDAMSLLPPVLPVSNVCKLVLAQCVVCFHPQTTATSEICY